MSVECGECEQDLRSGHAPDCPRAESTPDSRWLPPEEAAALRALAARFAEAVDAALDCTDAEPAHLCVTCRAQLRSVLAEYAAAK